MSEAPKVIIRKIIAVLDIPDGIPERLVKAKSVKKAMTGNSFFPAPNPALATVQTHIDTADAAVTAAQSHAAGAVQARDEAMKILMDDLVHLTAYVQGIADANPAKAETIITSAGLKVKKQGEINKQDFIVKNNKVSGTVDLIAKGIDAPNSAHQWGISPDGTDWISLALDIAPTLAAHTKATGLKRGSIMYFRHREILKKGPGGWSHTVDIVVT
jgi:hypothetical protein